MQVSNRKNTGQLLWKKIEKNSKATGWDSGCATNRTPCSVGFLKIHAGSFWIWKYGSCNKEVQSSKSKWIQTPKSMDAAMKMISELKAEVTILTIKLAEYKSIRGQLNTIGLMQQNELLWNKLQRYEGWFFAIAFGFIFPGKKAIFWQKFKNSQDTSS